MVKRRFLSVLLSLIVAISFIISFSACGNNETSGDGYNTEQGGENPSDEPGTNPGGEDNPETDEPQDIAVTSVLLDKTYLTLEIGESYTLTAIVSPSYATDKTITWSSTNPAAASVINGKITAKSEGSTTIIAEANNGKIAFCTVTVNKPAPEQGGENPSDEPGTNPGGEDNPETDEPQDIAVTSVLLDKTYLTLEIGESYTLTAIVSPSYATDKTITWSSTNPAAASVINGKITAKSEGSTTIIAEANNGKIAFCTVTVNKPAPEVIEVTSISLSKTSLTLDIKDTATLTATLLPTNATNKSVEWMSINEDIVKVVDGTIYPINEGKTTIYAITSNNLKASCEVIVQRSIPIQQIILNGGKDIYLLTGEEMTVNGTYWPGNATDDLTIVSSDESIFMVIWDDQGLRIKSIHAGIAKLIAKATSGVSCEITVNVYECNIEIPNSPMRIRNYDWDYFTVYYGNLTTIEGTLSIYNDVIYGNCLTLNLKLIGTITEKYFDPPKNFKITYKIRNESSIVLASGTLQTTTIDLGDSFVIETSILITDNLSSGNYTLELSGYMYDYIIGH